VQGNKREHPATFLSIYILKHGCYKYYGNHTGYSPFFASCQISARIIIAADGSGSRLAQQLRRYLLQQGDLSPLTVPEDSRTRYTAMRGYYSGIEDLSDALEFYFLSEKSTHYYWIFPVGDDSANVGVIASMEQLRAEHTDLDESLQRFLRSEPVHVRTGKAKLEGVLKAAPLAAGLRGTALYGDRILCVGDAAALVHPLTAEGISGALTSGRFASESALQALNQESYTKSTLSSYGTALRAHYQEPYDALIASDSMSVK
jgi:flavin-dependent dehydrogenase